MGIFFDNWMATHREPPKLFMPPPIVIPPLRVFRSSFNKGIVKQYTSKYYKNKTRPRWLRRKKFTPQYVLFPGKWRPKRKV